MEHHKVSEDYKKAYNQADMICLHMPHLLIGMTIPENKSDAYAQGFKDRIKQHREKQKNNRGFSLEQLKEKYKAGTAVSLKNKPKDLDKN